MKKALLGLLLVVVSPGTASGAMGFFGWGFRVGLADDPDQVVVGLHQDLGEIVEHLRFQPSFELGFGDDHTVVSGTLPVHYRFESAPGVTPYLGGGIRLAWIDRETRRRDDSEFEISPVFVGGAEWRAGKRSDVFLELQLSSGDAHEAKVVFGWMLRAR